MAALRTEVLGAADRLESARSLLSVDPAKAEESLISAQQSLHRLLDYYLPAVDARSRAYDAYRLCYLGESKAAAENAPAVLKKLALELNSMVVKGRLILPDDENPAPGS